MKMNAETDTPVPLRKQHTGMRYGLNERKARRMPIDRGSMRCRGLKPRPQSMHWWLKNLGVDGFAQGSADSINLQQRPPWLPVALRKTRQR